MKIFTSEEIVFKKEGEACGGHTGGNEGYCLPGLKCNLTYRFSTEVGYSNGFEMASKRVRVFVAPGKCVSEGKVFPK